MKKTILIIAKEGVSTTTLMSNIFRQFKDEIAHISNDAHHVYNEGEDITQPRDYPWPTENYDDEG
jgi:uridine kinase